MHHTLVVCVLQSFGCLSNVVTRLGEGQRTVLLDGLCQVRSIDEFHNKKVKIVGLLGVERCDDVRVIETRCRFNFAMKPIDCFLLLHPLAVDHFHCDLTIHHAMASPINSAHPTVTDLVQNLVSRMSD